MKGLLISLLLLLALPSAARELRYRPEGNDFVIENGRARFNRALYGTNTAFRVETGDVPEFGLFMPGMGGNIRLGIISGERSKWLTEADHIRSTYRPGARIYEIRDALFEGTLRVEVLAMADAEAAIVKVSGDASGELVVLYGGASDKRFDRNGDLNADPDDSFALHPEGCVGNTYHLPRNLFVLDYGQDKFLAGAFPVAAGRTIGSADAVSTPLEAWRWTPESEHPVFVARWEPEGESYFAIGKFDTYADLTAAFAAAEARRAEIAATLRIDTPDDYLNPVAGALSIAADGIWEPDVWLHGAVGWRIPLTGWRAAYTGDALGWHERSRRHFDGYAAAQITHIPPTIPHPAQDTALHLTRAAKVWGTPMYSNGYITRRPNETSQMHHYDMNLVYADALLWHLNWTGDWDYARKIWPTLERHLEWENRNFDPDDDGLYDAYACIWASDALMYNSGAVTHSTAYNYRANRLAAMIAEGLGLDATPYKARAEKILAVVNRTLWMEDKGWWAEYKDTQGNQLLHPDAGIWTIYHAIDSDLGTPLQAWRATRYVDEHIPHIAVNDTLSTISTTNWLPYSWSVNNVAFAEVVHMALAYWQAGRAEEAFALFKAAILDGMYMGESPGNVGQVSHYDAARGETYRDFGDPVGVYLRALVQGLFGVQPDALNDRLIVRPGFPQAWGHASMETSDLRIDFRRAGDTDTYMIENKALKRGLNTRLHLRGLREVESVRVNGRPAQWTLGEGVEWPLVEVDCGRDNELKVEIVWGEYSETENRKLKTENLDFEKTDFDQSELQTPNSELRMVDIDHALNASITDIFEQRYLSPRSPYTTLQTPWQGIGEWCHPLLTASIDDSGLRAKGGVLQTPFGVDFRTPASGHNIAFTTLWDNYPDRLAIPLTGQASRAWLLMAGTTNHMQSHVVNGRVVVRYTDHSADTLDLINPENWAPIEQDYYLDGKAFTSRAPRPYRVAFKTGVVSRDAERDMGVRPGEVYGRAIDGGAGIILTMPLDASKTLQSLRIEAVANEVIVGLMGLTLQR